jgi:putative spermidine/putrescine transport system ATP-binding protein
VGVFSIRPEKIRLDPAGTEPSEAYEPDDCRAEGVVREVVYLGSATHSIVDLDAGATLTVQQQNVANSIDHALAHREEKVVLTWPRTHLVQLSQPQEPSDKENP